MKTLGRNTVLLILLFASARASAQCGTTALSISYDSTVTGFANDLYNFTFPKFDPTLGTLTDVNIRATVSRVYGYELENRGPSGISNHRITIYNWDYISSIALPDMLEYSNMRLYGPHILSGSDGIPDSGPDFFKRPPGYLMNGVIYEATAHNTADFMGVGQVAFNYETLTSTAFGGHVAMVDYKNGTLEEEITFQITYNYCSAVILAADITSFTARKTNNGTVDIKWLTKNEKHNRKYELQKSTDGRIYRSVTEFAAQAGTETGSYSYTYQAHPDENNKIIYFRLKLKESNGKSKLSAVRAVKTSARPVEQPTLYPNPAKGSTTLLFSNAKRGNWEVEVMTSSGQLVKRYIFNNAQMARLNGNNELPRGLYIIRSVDKTTQQQFVQRLLVQ